MTRTLLTLISFLLLGAAASAQGLHVVFDLDGTLIDSVPPETVSTEDARIFRWKGEAFRLGDFAPEVIERLDRAGYRVSFFSGGDRERNEVIVEGLKALIRHRSGREFHPYKVLSREHLTPLFGRPDGARFRDRFRKDLQHVAFPGDVVLVDDLPDMLMEGQERSLLHVEPGQEGLRRRQKLLVVMEVLLEAKSLLARAPVQYHQAVRGLAHGVFGAGDYNDEAFVNLMRKALARFDLPLRLNEPSYPTYLRVRSCSRVFP